MNRRIPSLDGLRAVAICLVLYWHLTLSRTIIGAQNNIKFGYLGVLIFFVISGYIITKLLLHEKEQTGFVSLRKFYIRRLFRIMPALLLFLVGVAILARLNLSEATLPELLWSLTFLRNYHVSSFNSLGHLWSLSVEEQFYVLWPVIFSKCTRKTCIRVLLAVIALAPAVRLVIVMFHGGEIALYWHSESLADGLAMGCLLAMGSDDLHRSRFYRRFYNSGFIMLMPIVVLMFSYNRTLLCVFGRTVVFAAIAICIDVAILRADSLIGRLLNCRLLKWLGVLSYSLYLWQEVFTMESRGNQPYAWFPMNLALAIAAASASYYLIERPMLFLGRQILRNSHHAAGQVALELAGSNGRG